MQTTIINTFTGYTESIRSNGKPSVATIKRHLRAAKASGCQSVTHIIIDGIRHDMVDIGRGLQLVAAH